MPITEFMSDFRTDPETKRLISHRRLAQGRGQ
jgi:hypothetical protein